MMFSVPVFTLTTYVEEHTSYEFGLELIRTFSYDTSTEVFNVTFASYIDEHDGIRTPIINLLAKDRSWDHSSVSPDKLRSSELEIISLSDDDDNEFISIFDLRKNT